MVGGFYSDEDIRSLVTTTILADYQAATSAGAFGVPFNALLGFGADATGDFATNSFTQDAQSFSIFTHNVLSVTDKLDVTVGLRYVDESKDGAFTQIDGQHNACVSTLANAANIPEVFVGGAVALNCFIFIAPVLDFNDPALGGLFSALNASPAAALLTLLPVEFDDTFEDEELIYTFKASYDLSDDISVYGGFTHGFKSGGFNLDQSAASAGADPRFDSEVVDAYEAGLKGDFFDGRVRANVAVFHQDLTNFQVLEFTGSRFQTYNVGQAKVTGVEVETQAQLTDNFSAGLAVTYADARYPNDCDVLDPTGEGFNINAANLCGNALTNAPELVAVLNGSYERPVLDGKYNAFLSGSVRYESSRRTGTQATPVDLNDDTPLFGDIQDDNAKINLRGGISTADGRWAFELWGRNVTDQITRSVTFNTPLRTGARSGWIQDPRTYGATLRTKF